MSRRDANRLHACFWWFLALVFVGLAIAGSFRPEFGSAATVALLGRIFPGLGAEALATMAFWTRRAVHFLSYAALAAVLFNALRALCPRGGQGRATTRTALRAAAIAIAVAILDEALQVRSASRMGRAGDVGLDLAGVAAGALFSWMAARGKPSRRKARE